MKQKPVLAAGYAVLLSPTSPILTMFLMPLLLLRVPCQLAHRDTDAPAERVNEWKRQAGVAYCDAA